MFPLKFTIKLHSICIKKVLKMSKIESVKTYYENFWNLAKKSFLLAGKVSKIGRNIYPWIFLPPKIDLSVTTT